MSGDLKCYLLQMVTDRCGSGQSDHYDKLRARLQRATVTEPAPDFPLSDQTLNKLTNTMVMGKSLLGWIQTLHDMEQMYMPPRADAPQPTDAELRALLRAALPEGWRVQETCASTVGPRCYVFAPGGWTAGVAHYSTLRKPGGIEACARSLRVLAGVEGE